MSNDDHPPLPKKEGDKVRCTMPDGTVRMPTVIGEAYRFHDEKDKTKVLALHRLKFDSGKIELRLGYYLLSTTKKGKPYWAWNRYTAMLPPARLVELYKEAEAKEWFK